MKKIGISILLVIALLTVTACDKEEKQETNNTNKQVHEHCVRSGTVTNGTADLSYEIYYTGDVLNKIESTESVMSESSDVLDTYESAYRTIHEAYKDIKYYDTEVIRTDTSVTSIMIIDYDHVDVSKLIAMEDKENSIFENNIPKVSKYKEFGKKVGLSCTPVN